MNDMRVTKRALFRAIATAIPTLEVMGQTGATARAQQPQADGKFTSLDFSRLFNASREDFQPRDAIRRPSMRQFWERTLLVPAGSQTLRGIPFLLGPDGFQDKAWLALRRGGAAWTAQQAEVLVGKKASHLCLAQFCDWDETERDPASVDVIEKLGQPLAEVTLLYEDGTRHVTVIRRRFEVHSVDYPFGHLCFAALPHRQETPVGLYDPMAERVAALSGTTNPNRTGMPTLWLSALPNPSPENVIRAVRFESVAEDVLFVCGATIFHGRENPLRPDRLTLFRFVLPESEQGLPWEVSVDLGVVARTYKLQQFEAASWLASPTAGLGELPKPLRGDYLYAEVSATPDATLTLRNTKTGRRFEFNLADVY